MDTDKRVEDERTTAAISELRSMIGYVNTAQVERDDYRKYDVSRGEEALSWLVAAYRAEQKRNTEMTAALDELSHTLPGTRTTLASLESAIQMLAKVMVPDVERGPYVAGEAAQLKEWVDGHLAALERTVQNWERTHGSLPPVWSKEGQ